MGLVEIIKITKDRKLASDSQNDLRWMPVIFSIKHYCNRKLRKMDFRGAEFGYIEQGALGGKCAANILLFSAYRRQAVTDRSNSL